ncbi:MAG: hypothetical protein F6K24_50755 [Okeania sp. SIO2D1]|nr:hypothetical protein [Okeania sp. SIO2D1]
MFAQHSVGKQQGSLIFCFGTEAIRLTPRSVNDKWLNQQKTGRKGVSNTYSNVAIELMATVQS